MSNKVKKDISISKLNPYINKDANNYMENTIVYDRCIKNNVKIEGGKHNV